MTATCGDKFILVDTTRGIQIRTATDLRAMITELIMNSGEEIAFWAEGEAKRCADRWREANAEREREEAEMGANLSREERH